MKKLLRGMIKKRRLSRPPLAASPLSGDIADGYVCFFSVGHIGKWRDAPRKKRTMRKSKSLQELDLKYAYLGFLTVF
jgi:hypothetical protein